MPFEITNLAVDEPRFYYDGDEMPELRYNDDRRESSGFIGTNADGHLYLHVPYDSGVCYQTIDLERLIEYLYGEGNPPEWMFDRLRGLCKTTNR